MKKNMKRLTLILCLMTCVAFTYAQQIFTIPQVQTWKPAKGSNTVVLGKASTISEELQYAADFMNETNNDSTGVGVLLNISKNKKLGNEGYKIIVGKKAVTVEGCTPQAVMWGIQTLMQLKAQSKDIPCGTIIDKPDYRLRGFMIDCGRKFIPMDYLKNLVKVMSHYKMNTLGVHLNDNGFKKYFHQNWDETYAAFRMESDLFPELTARDGYYTKKEFREFVLESAKMGVEIIPEIDVPAHSLAFTHFRPSLGCEEFGVDHLDLTNPEVVPFLDSLFVEYIGGPEPVFAGPRVHIGTDEYSNKKQEVVELFRSLTDHLITLCKQHGKQPVVWGSLTYAKGETPVQVDGVLMDMWSNGFADPKEMKEAGYQMVNIPDGWVYIVPAAGYYYDYLNTKLLYERWTPANINGVKFEEKDPQIEGGMFAVWNDVCGNGISIGDIHHRVVPAMQAIAHKTWHAVNDTIGYQAWNEKRMSVHLDDYELGNCKKLSLKHLSPRAKLFETETQAGYNYEVSFDITWNKERIGAVLTESSRAKFYLSDPISGMLGYSRDGYLFTFNYSGRSGVKEHISIKGDNKKTELWVNGKLIQTLGYDQRIAFDNKPYNIVRTLMFPLTRAGVFKSRIRNFEVK